MAKDAKKQTEQHEIGNEEKDEKHHAVRFGRAVARSRGCEMGKRRVFWDMKKGFGRRVLFVVRVTRQRRPISTSFKRDG